MRITPSKIHFMDISSSPIAEYENALESSYTASQRKLLPTLMYLEEIWGRVAPTISSCGGAKYFTEVCILEGLQGPKKKPKKTKVKVCMSVCSLSVSLSGRAGVARAV